MLKRLLALAFAVFVFTPDSASGHLIAQPRSKALEHVEVSQARNLAHARYVCRRGGGDHRKWACRAAVRPGWLRREHGETWRALHPPVPAIAHRSLWLCIHSREGAWDDGGWPYWGGLQMGGWFLSTYLPAYSSPEGSSGPGGWRGAPSAEVQMAAAERGYRQSGYSRAWLYGQWPNTAPPCS